MTISMGQTGYVRSARAGVILFWATFLASAIALSGGDLRILEAAKQNDLKALHLLLGQHVDVNATQADGATALMWAAHWNNLEMVESLLAAGANVNVKNDY